MDYSQINEVRRILLVFEAQNYPKKANGILVNVNWYSKVESFLLKNIVSWGIILPDEGCIKIFGIKVFRTIDINEGEFIAF